MTMLVSFILFSNDFTFVERNNPIQSLEHFLAVTIISLDEITYFSPLDILENNYAWEQLANNVGNDDHWFRRRF